MKNIKNIVKYIFTISSFFVVTTACRNENFGDINKDEFGVYNFNHKSLLSGAIMNFAQNGGNAYKMQPELYVQYQSQYVYTTEQRYGETPGAWARYYVNQINSLNKIIDDYSGANVTPSMLEQGSKENMIGVAKIFRAIILKRITDSYGNIPFSEALKLEQSIKTPKYDSQESIYKQIFQDLKSGRDILDAETTKPQGDIIYYGDVNKWKKLANSVILQSALQLSRTPLKTIASEEFKNALNNSAGVIDDLEDEAWFTFSGSNSLPNPNSNFRAADYRLSRELVQSLRGNGTFNRTSNHTLDYRLKMYNNNFSVSSTIVGLPYGYSANGLGEAGYSAPGSGSNTIGIKFRSSDSPMALMTAAYTKLNRAEGATLGWSTEDVKVLVKDAIMISYSSLDSKYVTNSELYSRIATALNTYGGPGISTYASDYANARVLDIDTYGAKRVIGEEKWVALFNQGFDSWSEWRRTGFPALVPSTEYLNEGQIPRRLNYPTDEVNFNTTNYQEALKSLMPTVDKNTSKVWWDQ